MGYINIILYGISYNLNLRKQIQDLVKEEIVSKKIHILHITTTIN